jgi:hypothetical protein
MTVHSRQFRSSSKSWDELCAEASAFATLVLGVGQRLTTNSAMPLSFLARREVAVRAKEGHFDVN